MDSFVHTVALVLIISAFSQLEASPTDEEKDIQVFGACMEEHNIEESVVEDIFSNGKVPETNDVKCFLGCYMTNMEYMNSEGVIDWNKLDESSKAQYTDSEELEKVLEVSAVCRQKVPQDLGNSCEAAFVAMKCYIEEAQKRHVSLATK